MHASEHAEDLPRYAEWAPGPGDARGLCLPDQQEWRVLLSQHRDSEALDRSNFTAATESLDAVDTLDFPAYEIHRFGHWAVGWVEIILVNPEHGLAMTVAGEIACALADYPILDETAFTELEADEAWEAWESWGFRDWLRSQDLSEEARDLMEDYGDRDACLRAMDEESGRYWGHGDWSYTDVPRDVLAELVKQARERRDGDE